MKITNGWFIFMIVIIGLLGAGATTWASARTLSSGPTKAGLPTSLGKMFPRTSTDQTNSSIEATTTDLVELGQIGGQTTAIFATNGYIYANVGPRLDVFDSSNPLRPTFVGQSKALPQQISDIWVEGNLVYVADGTGGLQILNVSDPTEPILIGALPTSRNSLGIHVVNSYAYIANRDGGLRIVDVSNPTQPYEVGVYINYSNWSQDVRVVDHYAYVAIGTGGLDVVDVADPMKPTFVTNVNVGNALGLDVDGNYLYVAAGDKLSIIDVSLPGDPDPVSYVPITKGTVVGVDIEEGFAYVAATDYGLRIIDVSDPNLPEEVGSYPNLEGAWNVAAVGQMAYVAAGLDNLVAIDVSDPGHTRRTGRYDIFGLAQGIDIVGNYAYVGAGQDGLWIVDVTDPASMTVAGSLDTNGNTRGTKVVGDYAYLAGGQAGLYIMNVSDVSSPTLIKWFTDTLTYVRALDIISNTLYLADQEVVVSLDVTDPAQPTILHTSVDIGGPNGIQVAGDYVYVACGSAGLSILDKTDLSVVGHLDVIGNSWDIQVENNFAYLAAGLEGLWVVDVTDPFDPQHITTYPVPGNSVGIYVSSSMVYLADGLGEVRIIDVHNPQAPMEVAAYDSPGYAEDTIYNGGIIYLADGAGGLFTFSTTQSVTPMAPNVSLSRIGTTFLGEQKDDDAGGAVAGLGDINNDGFDDFAISSFGRDIVYIFFGKTEGWASISINLKNADASLLSVQAGDNFGSAIAGAGDVNGDGIDDFLIGASDYDGTFTNAGQVYLVLGNSDPNYWHKNTPITDVAAASFWGEADGDKAGSAAVGAGDVDNDGSSDLLIGAPQNDANGPNSGKTYLVYGAAITYTMDQPLASVAAASFLGLGDNVKAGSTLAWVGSVDGDEYDDLLIGSWTDRVSAPNAGSVFLYLGANRGLWTKNMVMTSPDASFEGEELGDWAGYSIAGVGSVDGDSFNDFVIGAPGDDFRGRQTGIAYLILGKATGWAQHTSLSQANASFLGETTEDWAGSTVAGIGDIDGDGYKDFLIGAIGDTHGGRDAGQIYLILGRPKSAWIYEIELSNADASFWGEATGNNAGGALAGVGDVDGDGLSDFIIGAPNNNDNGSSAGKSYLLFGNEGPTGGIFTPAMPFAGVGVYNQLTTTYYDLANKYDNLRDVYMILSGGGKEITLQYKASKDKIYMLNDGLTIGLCVPGQVATLSNGVFELNCETTTISNNGDTRLSVDWQLRVLEAVTSPYYLNATLVAWDKNGNKSRPYMAGSWLVDPDAPVTDLSQVDTSFLGENDHDQAGWSVASAGDVNNDGFTDLLVGAPNYNEDSSPNVGKAYLFFGNEVGWGQDLSLSLADVSFIGEEVDNYAGFAVTGVGDVNGDGYDDILIGAYRNNQMGITAGKAYMILGRPTEAWDAVMLLANADASYLAETGSDYVGYTVAAAGDVNNDGLDDMLIGAWGRENGNENQAGMAYLILGKPTGWYTDTSLSQADASFLGEHLDDWASFGLAGIGDTNGDNFDDFLISAPNDAAGVGASTGQVYLILGKLDGWYTNTLLSQVDIPSFVGEATGDLAGMDVAAAGDVNRDGYDDFLVGASGASGRVGQESGKVYLILGKADGWTRGASLTGANAIYTGERRNDRAGRAVTGLGDVNADGYPDIAVGSYGSDDGGSSAGKVYVIFGQAEYFGYTTSLSQADLMYWGEQSDDEAGFDIAGIQGMIGPGSRGLFIGAPGNGEVGKTNSGQAYLVMLADRALAPQLFSIDPTTVVNNIENTITLNGTDFQPVPIVTLGTTPLATVFVNTQTLTATVPVDFPTGIYTVTVTNPDSQQDWLSDAFTVTAPLPDLQSVIPANITNEIAQVVTLSGLYFQSTPTVTVGMEVVDASFVNSEMLTATVPAGFPTGVYTVTVTNPDGKFDSLADALIVSLHAPDLQSVEPISVTNNVDNVIALNGFYFQSVPTVTLGTTSLTVTFINSQTLTATVPADFPAGVYDITVINPDGQQDWMENALTVISKWKNFFLPLVQKFFP